ncbi:MAG: adenylate/guanylate cyclase domain-containing protein [Candidatus Promineifilaceae bacterium]|nr:adenylate/guanylate cyclase domain-containing protein [Candidatus Promineifilaceae bacterium]
MSDANEEKTLTDVSNLRQLVDELGQQIDRNRQVAMVPGSADLNTWRNDVIRLLTRMRLSMDSLAHTLENQAQERKQLRALQEVGAVINSSLDQAEVLNTVMDTIIQLTGAERGFLMLADEQTGELRVETARNINRATIDESSFEFSRSIVQDVYRSGKPVVSTDAQTDYRFDRQESIIGFNLRSILCVPLRIKDNTIGVIYADNRLQAGIFGDQDRDLLAAFANQAAVAIENARLFAQIRDQLDDITEMKNLQDDVFESMATGVITIDLADRVSLYNRAAESILGIPQHRVMDKDYRVLLEAPIDGVVETVVENIQDNGGQQQMELDAKLRRRTRTLNLTFTPLRDIQQQTRGVALVLDDITEQRRTEALRRYLPPALVEQVRDVDAVSKPNRRIISLVFGDVRGFTSISERWEPEFLIEVLNGHLSVAADAINIQEGLIDKYDGDTVMALYNTPINPQDDHVERAVRTALTIQLDISAYHETIPEEERLHFGIGVHVGEAVVGNVGSALRKDYSAIGDAVNLSKRLQELAGEGEILISDAVYQAVGDKLIVEKLEPVRVKGRQAKTQIFRLNGLK